MEQKIELKSGEWLIIVPTYNERENIGLLISAIFQSVPGVHVLVVDDGSPDGTLTSSRPCPTMKRPFLFSSANGKRAWAAPISPALNGPWRGVPYVFEMDADFSHDPAYLPRFCEAIKGSELVIGSRYINGVNVINWPMSRLLLSYYANAAIQFLFGIRCSAPAGFKCFRRALLAACPLTKSDRAGMRSRSRSIT